MVIITKGKSLVEGNVQELLNAQELTVRLELSDVNKAISLIQQHFANVEITRLNEVEISLSIEKQQVPHLNKMLGDNNILVYALEPKRKLEDFFMKIVQS
jgi:ABC-type multidrug transport system ATPase subunit